MPKRKTSLRAIDVDPNSLEEINQFCPCSLKTVKHLVDRIYEQYPLADHTTITFVVKKFLEEFRNNLLIGKTLMIGGTFTDIRMVRFRAGRQGVKVNLLKVKLRTPEKLKK